MRDLRIPEVSLVLDMQYELYIDGGFLRAAAASHASTRDGRHVLAREVKLNFQAISSLSTALAKQIPSLNGYSSKRPRYYDAIIEPKDGQSRTKRDAEFLDAIEKAHIVKRLGTMQLQQLRIDDAIIIATRATFSDEMLPKEFSRFVEALKAQTKRYVQKGVDVQLAIDLLTRGLDGNYGVAVLLAGDEDFVSVLKRLRAANRDVILLAAPGTTGANAMRSRVSRKLQTCVRDVIPLTSEQFAKLYWLDAGRRA